MQKDLLKILLACALSSTTAFAQTTGDQNIPLTQSEVNEVHELLDQIKSANPPQNGFIRTRTGLIQFIMNTTTNVKLSPDNVLPAVGTEGFFRIHKNLGFEGSLVYSTVYEQTAVQQGNMLFYKVGPRYTFYLDRTNLANFFAVKLFYHVNENTFKPLTTDLLLINKYRGYALSIERSIPASRKIGILASLDLMQITEAKANNSTQSYVEKGLGFEFRGEIFYTLPWFKSASRLGLAYWQQSYANEMGYDGDNIIRYSTNRQNFFQVSRAIWASYSVLF